MSNIQGHDYKSSMSLASLMLSFVFLLTVHITTSYICDPATLNEAFENITDLSITIYCNKQDFLHILMPKIIGFQNYIKSYNSILNINIWYDSIQNNYAEIWALKDCNGSIKKQMYHNTPFPT